MLSLPLYSFLNSTNHIYYIYYLSVCNFFHPVNYGQEVKGQTSLCGSKCARTCGKNHCVAFSTMRKNILLLKSLRGLVASLPYTMFISNKVLTPTLKNIA